MTSHSPTSRGIAHCVASLTITLALAGCGDDGMTIPRADAGPTRLDAGGGRTDAGGTAGTDGGGSGGRDGGANVDGGASRDAGGGSPGDAGFSTDAGSDAGNDAGVDAFVPRGDAGPPTDGGVPCIPWPTEGMTYSSLALIRTTSYTWHRPVFTSRTDAMCPAPDASSAQPYYNLYTFCAPATPLIATVDVLVHDDDPTLTLTDSLLVAYEGDRIPMDVRACYAANDDRVSLSFGSRAEFTVIAGQPIALAVSGWDRTTLGSYELRVVTRPRPVP